VHAHITTTTTSRPSLPLSRPTTTNSSPQHNTMKPDRDFAGNGKSYSRVGGEGNRAVGANEDGTGDGNGATRAEDGDGDERYADRQHQCYRVFVFNPDSSLLCYITAPRQSHIQLTPISYFHTHSYFCIYSLFIHYNYSDLDYSSRPSCCQCAEVRKAILMMHPKRAVSGRQCVGIAGWRAHRPGEAQNEQRSQQQREAK